MRKSLILSSLFLGASVTCGAAEPLSVCQVLNRQEEINGRTVRVSGIVRRTNEAAALIDLDPKCSRALLLEYPSQVANSGLQVRNDEMLKAFTLAFTLMDFGLEAIELELKATFEGRFETVVKIVDGKEIRTGGGFGHLRGAGQHLILTRVLQFDFSNRSALAGN